MRVLFFEQHSSESKISTDSATVVLLENTFNVDSFKARLSLTINYEVGKSDPLLSFVIGTCCVPREVRILLKKLL